MPRLAVSQNGLPTPADIWPAFYRAVTHVIQSRDPRYREDKKCRITNESIRPATVLFSHLKVIRDLIGAKGGMDGIDSFDNVIRQRSLLNDVEVGVELVEV